MSLSLTVLGGFALESRSAVLPLKSRKARALLVALALARHRTMSRARLAQMLWEASDAEQARGSLRQTLAQLRRAGVELATPDADNVALPDSVNVDLDAFSAAISEGDAAEAIRLYRGDLMEGHAYRESSIDDWLQRERTRIRDLAVEAFVFELDRLGDRPEAAELAHRLIALDPLRERAHRTLMRLDAARGDTSAALARYASLRDLLERELNTAPEPETTALARSIRRNEPTEPAAPANAAAPIEPLPDDHLRRVVVLAGLESDGVQEDGWDTALAEAAIAAGGDVLVREAGQVVAVWGLERTRENDASVAAGLARAVIKRIGAAASFGLSELAFRADGGPIAAGRFGSRAIRLAAAAAPGTLAIDPKLGRWMARPGRPEPVLVGRESELAQALGAARAALSKRRGVVINLVGEAGIGKTRLAQEIARNLADEALVTASVGFDSFGTAPHLGQQIASALPRRLPLPSMDPFDRAALAALEGRELTVGDRLRLDAVMPDERFRRDLRATEALLVSATGSEGLFLTIEDCHWTNHLAAEFILQLADATARHPIVMLLTERPGADALGPRLAARGQTSVARLVLAPLAPTDAETLARALSSDSGRASRAVSLAGGHPLFLLRLLEAEFDEESLPSTILGLVQEQIERLPKSERTALRQASILGRRFRPADFQALFGGPPPAPTGDLLVTDGDLCSFGHDLIHRAIYESVPEDLRRRLHAKAAGHYRDRDAIRWSDHAALSDDDVDASRAAAAAANAMIAARRFRAALPYVEAGLARAGDPEAMAELHSCRAAVRRIRGDMNGALDDYRAAHSHAVRHPTQVSMLTRMALVLHRLDRGAEADRALDDAETIADRAGIGGVARAEIHEQRGNRAWVAGDHETCARHHGAALALAEPTGNLRTIARAHGGLGDAAYAAGRMRSAYKHFDTAISIAEKGGLGVVVEEYGFMRAEALYVADPGPEARTLIDLAVEGAQASGAARTEMIAREIRAEARLVSLDLDGAVEDIDAVSHILADHPESRFEDDLLALRALLAHRSGNSARARELILPVIEGAAANRYAGGLTLGIAALAAPDAKTWHRVLAFGEQLVCQAAISHSIMWFRRLAMESAILRGEGDIARAQIAQLRNYTASEPLGLIDLAIENAELHLDFDAVRARELRERARLSEVLDLPPLQ